MNAITRPGLSDHLLVQAEQAIAKLDAYGRDHPGMTDEESESITDQLDELEATIADTPAAAAEGILIKLRRLEWGLLEGGSSEEEMPLLNKISLRQIRTAMAAISSLGAPGASCP